MKTLFEGWLWLPCVTALAKASETAMRKADSRPFRRAFNSESDRSFSTVAGIKLDRLSMAISFGAIIVPLKDKLYLKAYCM
jgi:hypothetical protein